MRRKAKYDYFLAAPGLRLAEGIYGRQIFGEQLRVAD
jgi:hypothetical protein